MGPIRPALLLLAATAPLTGCATAQAPVASQAVSAPRTILFIGNSFTQGAGSDAFRWGADTVEDLNGDGIGGVPALFKAFTKAAGLNYAVSLETQGGKSLGFHYDERRARFDRPWDVVVLQEYSTLSAARPGDAREYLRDVGRLSSFFTARNRNVRTYLMSTWSRADLTWQGNSPWTGQGIDAMATDLRAAADRAKRQAPGVTGVLPIGQAWGRAFAAGVADANPYDGIAPGQVDLWADDHYHASAAGTYLEALVVFGRITGRDPRTLGAGEKSAAQLGLSPALTARLQQIAHDSL